MGSWPPFLRFLKCPCACHAALSSSWIEAALAEAAPPPSHPTSRQGWPGKMTDQRLYQGTSPTSLGPSCFEGVVALRAPWVANLSTLAIVTAKAVANSTSFWMKSFSLGWSSAGLDLIPFALNCGGGCRFFILLFEPRYHIQKKTTREECSAVPPQVE